MASMAEQKTEAENRSMAFMRGALSVAVIGASGDLAKKKTYPALLELWCADMLPRHVRVFGYARSAKTDDGLREMLRPYLLKTTPAEDVEAFLERCVYVQGQYGSPEAFGVLASAMDASETEEWAGISKGSGAPVEGNRLFYFAIPPNVFIEAARAIKAAASCPVERGWTRLIIEKPFGHDYPSSQELCSAMSDTFPEESLYRIDHYLGKEMVQNLLVLRFGNLFLGPLWNRDHIAAVIISFKEDFGTEGRGGYFDKFGIIRDIMQNHLMQVLSLVAMEPPTRVRGDAANEAIRDAKVNVLKCIEPIQLEDVVLGQYVANGDKPGYRDDDGVPNSSMTPTFCSAVIRIRNQRWDGVPFIMTAGKALDCRKAEVRIQFKDVPGAPFLFDGLTPERNELVIRIQPDTGIFMQTNVKAPGLQSRPVRSLLDLTYANSYSGVPMPEAYTRLILEVLRGNQAPFVRMDELLQAWAIFTPLLNKIEGKRPVKPLKYKYGTPGPREASVMASMAGYVLEDGTRYSTKAVRHLGPHTQSEWQDDSDEDVDWRDKGGDV